MRFGLAPRSLGRSTQNLTIRTDAVVRARFGARDICACRQIVIGNRSLANLAAAHKGSGSRTAVAVLEKRLPGGQSQAMHAHFVLAHLEPQSFNAHLVRSGSAALEAEGWTTSVSDLYAMGFDPCERHEHYRDRAALLRFDTQLQQRHASENGGLPKAVTDELAILDRADLLVLQYPMWWHLPPAMLKGWFDRVLAYGAAYTSKKRFERGRFVGKRAMLSVTVGTSRSTYEHDGRSGDINLMLWPINFTLAYVGYDIVAPYVAYGVEAGLRYSEPAAVEGWAS